MRFAPRSLSIACAVCIQLASLCIDLGAVLDGIGTGSSAAVGGLLSSLLFS